MLAHPTRVALLLLALSATPWVVGLSNPIQDVDPAQYADVARHVAEGGGWLDLRDGMGPFVNKPPLSIWAQAAAMKAFGPTAFAARLPSLFFALLTLGATFALGRRLLDATRGAVAACLVAATVSMQQMVCDPKVDLALTAMATLALWAFVEARKRAAFVWLGWVFSGLAVLSKGPLGLALAAAAIGPEAIRSRWGGATRGTLRERLFALKPVRGVSLVAAIAAPYYWSIYQRDGAGAAGFVIWRQNFGRIFGGSGYQNDTTPLFFLHTALWAFAPLTPLLIAALWTKGRALWTTRKFPPSEPRLLVWGFAIPFVVFSMSEYKLPQYIFCLAPLAALLSADLVCGLTESGLRRARVGFAVLGVIAAALLGWLVIDCVPFESAGATAAWIAIAVAAPITAWGAARRWPAAWQITTGAVAATAVFHLLYAGWVFPQLVRFQAGEALALRARHEDPTATLIPFVDLDPTFAVAFYGGVPVRQVTLDALKTEVLEHRASTAVVNGAALPDFASVGLRAERIERYTSYPTSRPKLAFLRATTREAALEWRELVRVTPQ